MADKETKTDVGSFVTKNISVDKEKGTFSLFGRQTYVGKDFAAIADGLVGKLLDWISDRGASTARRFGIQVAETLKAPADRTQRVGLFAEIAWRFGIPVVDLLMNLKKSIHNGFKGMNALKEEASAVLAANNNMKVGVGGVLSTHFSALAYERALIFKESKKSMLASFAGTIRNLPSIILNVLRLQKNLVNNPEQLWDRLPKNATDEEKRFVEEKITKLKAMREPLVKTPIADGKAAGGKEEETDGILSSLSRLFKPKDLKLDDINTILNYGNYATPLGGIAAGLISGDLEKNVGKTQTAWRKIQQLKNVIKEQEPDSTSDIAHLVKGVFEQHAINMGIKDKPAGKKFEHIIEEISYSLIHDRLHPDALVELLDDPKVIVFDKKGITYGKVALVKEECEKLVDKYSAKVNQKEFYEAAPFSPKDAVAAWDNLTDEERPLYVLFFSKGVLEAAGVPKEQVAKYTDGDMSLSAELTNIMRNVVREGREGLEKAGVSDDLIEEYEAVEKDFNNALRHGRGKEYIEKNLEDTTALIRNMAVTAKDQDGFWQEFVGKRENEAAGTDEGLRFSKKKDIQDRKITTQNRPSEGGYARNYEKERSGKDRDFTPAGK